MKKRFLIAMIPAGLLALSGTAMLWHSLFISEQKIQSLTKVQDLTKQSRLGIVEESNALRGILINPKSEKDIGDKIRSGQAKRQALEEVKTISQSQDVQKLTQELIDFDEKHLLPAETTLQKLVLDRRKREARSFFNRQFQPMRDLYDELSAALVTTAQTEARVLLEARQREIFWTLGVVGFAFLLTFFVFSILSWNVRELIRSGIRHLKNEYNELWNTAQHMAEMSQDVADGFSEHQEGLGAITTSVKEIDDTFRRGIANVRKAQETSTRSMEVARRGQGVMEKMIQTFGQMSDNHRMVMEQVNEGNARVQEIVQVINEISKKTQVINEIVFQTKLLSFNASIEAARAGEHGKGFSVVASEIGKLASMSGEAAKGISSMLDGSVQKVEGIVAHTRNQVSHLGKSGQDRLEAGVAVAEDCRISLAEIVSSVDHVRSIAREMEQESQDQAAGLESLAEVIQRLQGAGHRHVSQALEVNGAAHNLLAQAEELKYAIKMIAFKVDGIPQKKHRLLERHSGMSL